jgi:hypothetical protein
MRVEFVVDEIVLHGLDARDRHRIGDAIERHLTTRLARESSVDRITSDVRNREHAVRNIVTESVQAAVAPPTARRS